MKEKTNFGPYKTEMNKTAIKLGTFDYVHKMNLHSKFGENPSTSGSLANTRNIKHFSLILFILLHCIYFIRVTLFFFFIIFFRHRFHLMTTSLMDLDGF